MASRFRTLQLVRTLGRQRTMTSKTSHEERTAADRREPGMHTVLLDQFQQVNRSIRMFKLRPLGEKPKFLPGQWLDLHVPGIPQAGGFTITSTPKDLDKSNPYLGLAVQDSPGNPPAAWLWQRSKKILGKELRIRIGGSFVWPPPGIDINQVQKVVFVAGGVGINPLISILTHLIVDSDYQGQIELLYSSRKGPSNNMSSILFMDQIRQLFEMHLPQRRHHFTVFCTGSTHLEWSPHRRKSFVNVLGDRNGDKRFVGEHQGIEYRRFEKHDLETALGPEAERANIVAYVCGPPPMTDWAVDVLRRSEGMEEKRVLCEKWW